MNASGAIAAVASAAIDHQRIPCDFVRRTARDAVLSAWPCIRSNREPVCNKMPNGKAPYT
jgi:hypothetical protein